MLKEKRKEKNIVGETKDSHLFSSLLSITPSISYGRFRVGTNVSDYNDCIEKTYSGDNHYTLDEYVVRLYGYAITLCCRESGFIETICFDEHCLYNGKDLIGMNILDFMRMMNKEPDSVDIDWVPTKDENHGQNQRCYCFYFNRSHVIQLWTWRKRIVNLTVYDYRL